jgi:predicted ester cyclase
MTSATSPWAASTSVEGASALWVLLATGAESKRAFPVQARSAHTGRWLSNNLLGREAEKETEMSAHDQKAVSRRSLEMWSSHDSGWQEDIFGKHYVNHQEPDVHGATERNLDTWRDLLGEFRKAFSSRKVRIPMQIAEGDLVANRFEFTATHTGEFLGRSPTSRETTWTGVQIDRFKDGKIVES